MCSLEIYYFIQSSKLYLELGDFPGPAQYLLRTSVFQPLSVPLQVTFTSLDVMLHTEALLSAVNFLSTSLSSSGVPSAEKDVRPKTEGKMASVKSS